MKKISKKIVALVTMAMFVLTLVPFAAFAVEPVTIQEDTTAKTVNVIFNEDAENVTINVTKDGVAQAYDLCDYNGQNDLGVNTGEVIAAVTGGIYNYQIKNLPSAASYTVTVTSNNGTTPLGSETFYIPGNVTNGASYLTINGATTVTVNPEETRQVTFNLVDINQNASAGSLNRVHIWAENADGYLTDAVTFSDGTGANAANGTVGTTNNKFFVLDDGLTNGKTVTATFNYPGEYTIYAATASGYTANLANATTAESALTGINPLGGGVEVTINNRTYVTDHFVFAADAVTGTDDKYQIVAGDKAGQFELDLKEDTVLANGTKVYTVTGRAMQADGTAAQYELLNISSNKAGLQILDEQVGTNNEGYFTFRFVVTQDTNFKITIEESNGDASAVINVDKTNISLEDISVVEDGGYLLAGNDSRYARVNSVGTADYFADAVKIAITDSEGNAVSGNLAISKEPANSVADPDKHDDYVRVLNRATNSTLTADDIVLAWSETYQTYTLALANGVNAATALVPGEYTVRVSLTSSESVDVDFNVARFGTIQDLVLDLTASTNGAADSANDNAIRVLTDTVALGQRVTISPKWVDENGIKVLAEDVNLAVNGDAVATRDLASYQFTTANNIAANNSLIGTVVTIGAVDVNNGKYVERDLTVVKAYLEETLAFNPTQGDVDRNNVVNVSVVDADGNVSRVSGTLYAYIEDQSNADANIDLTVNENVRGGQGSLVLRSDAEGTVDVRVVVVSDNGEMYAQMLTYAFGAAPTGENTVVMTIGSADYVVNNVLVTGDAEPYVDSNWRTMVPIRALAESFGAYVDHEDGVITIVDGSTTVVMTVGDETYSVNGTEAEMDTAPVIGKGDRAYVPVRFVAEALGYDVTPLYDVETSLTASVVFQK